MILKRLLVSRLSHCASTSLTLCLDSKHCLFDRNSTSVQAGDRKRLPMLSEPFLSSTFQTLNSAPPFPSSHLAVIRVSAAKPSHQQPT